MISIKTPIASVMADGEIVEGVHVIVPAKRKNGFNKGWYAMATDATGELINLVLQKKLQPKDVLTLLAMLEVLELENYIRISQRHLAERLQMLPPNISRSIKALISNGILLLGPKVGNSSTFRLNPHFGWKGGALQHHKALRERMDAANISGVVTRDPNTVDFIAGSTDQEART